MGIKLKDNYYTLVIDGDTPLFRSATALEESYVEVWWKDRVMECKNKTHFKGGKINGRIIKGKLEEINKDRENPFALEEFDFIHKVRLIDSPNDAARLGLGKKWIREYISGLYNIPWVKKIVYCLSSESCFRKDIEKTYKENRGKKPILLPEIRKWFLREFKNIVGIREDLEADDLLSIYGHRSRNSFTNPKDSDIVLCGYDKDLLQIYNNYFFDFDHREDGVSWIDEFTGQKKLAIQCLCGDSVDNIKGLPKVTNEIKEKYGVRMGGVGKGKAKQILSYCESVECLFKTVEDCYRSYYKDKYKDALNTQFKLVKLLEKPNEIKDFPFSE